MIATVVSHLQIRMAFARALVRVDGVHTGVTNMMGYD